MTNEFTQKLQIPDRVLTAIRSHAAASSLFDEIGAFYGKPIHINPALSVQSHYECPIELARSEKTIMWPPTSCPSISIAAGQRELQAACHEMLHLLLPVRGYAKFCHKSVRAMPERLEQKVKEAVNQIEHQVMFPWFLRLGFPANTFLVSGNERPVTGGVKCSHDGRGQMQPPRVDRLVMKEG